MQARFAPADSTLSVGAPGALSIILVNARDVLSLEVVLAYDPSVIEVVDLGPGALLSLDGSTLGVERQLDRGRARARFTRPRPGSGSGAVALLTFKGVREGASPVLIEALTVATPAGPVSVAAGDQGRVTVKP
jgi:hypothetical protein